MLNIPYLVPGASSGIWYMALRFRGRGAAAETKLVPAAWLRPPLGEGIILLPTATAEISSSSYPGKERQLWGTQRERRKPALFPQMLSLKPYLSRQTLS